MKPTLIPLQRTAFQDFSPAQFADWALSAHDARCATCRNSERCPAGLRYEAATKTSNDDIPGLAGV